MRIPWAGVAACAALAAGSGCDGGGRAADAALADASVDAGTVPCEAGAPGARIHLTFEGPPNSGSRYTWTGQPPEPALTMSTTGGGGTGCPVAPEDVDADGKATVACMYPPGTVAGPASVDFYAIASGPFTWISDRPSFTANPTACVDVDLAVHYYGVDAGPDAAP